MVDIIEAGHFTWEDAADEYAALVTRWWAEAMRPPELRQHADRSGPPPGKHLSGGFAVTARTERSETKSMRLESPAARANVVTGTDRGRQGGLMEVTVMSLSPREQQALASMEDGLTGSDPKLASLLATFARLASDEEMPVRENIRAIRHPATRRPRRNQSPRRGNAGRDVRGLCLRLGWPQTMLLLWLAVTIALMRSR